MLRIGILGDIGSGKSYVARCFKHPVFNADDEVTRLYKTDVKIFKKLKKSLPKFIYSFPISKSEITRAILSNNNNLKKIIQIVHQEVRKKLQSFLKKNKNKKIVILDIPLLLENKINKKKDILVFVQSNKKDVLKKLKKRKGINYKLIKKFKKIQLPLDYKKNKSHFIIKNDFTKKTININIKDVQKKLNR